ncbi:helix-turn-helix transcriptional regulator [Butyribacter intestini]|jgi:AraC-like DNA-binding protein/mannose-6-phosphate isomerase-like protein (cupin superfamily)|uniref:helix-turn-helix transcriptional regulator n=1 Tax=Butyribacter intestini TaxID=1703332 RepID=UPI0022E0DA82|nr:AraC family transcriptional regulator [Butyribacter intestini]
MSRKKEYEEKEKHGTAQFPVGLHKLEYPADTDVMFYVHWHQEFEFLVLTEGKVLFTIEDRKYVMNPGDIVFINSNYLHMAKNICGGVCSFYAIDFSYHVLNEDIHSIFSKKFIRPILNDKYVFPEFMPVSEDEDKCWQKDIRNYLHEIGECPEHELEPFELMIRSRILAIWDILDKNCVRSQKDNDIESRYSERLEPVISYIKENYAYEITLGELAAILPMSEGQFSRVFKQTMKLSPIQYLMRYRILQSCKLLQDTEKKIGEIANLSGFNNISYFNRVFLNTIGCTPKEYRENSSY